ncbi:spermatogenesis associated protein 5 [Podila epigama]|nr:spermatogenesis associated protein 5 [Podila epigama]
MDLKVSRVESIPSTAGAIESVRTSCLVHPDTLLEIGIPSLGFGSLQHDTILEGRQLFVKCLPHAAVQPGHIVLQNWIALACSSITGDEIVARLEKVGHVDTPVVVATKVVIAARRNVETLANWIKPTNPANTQHAPPISSGQSGRHATENTIKRSMQGHPIAQGSAFMARVKAQSHIFNVLRVEYQNSNVGDEPVQGVIGDATEIEIVLPDIKLDVNYSVCYGMEKLSKEICRFITTLITGVSGSGKKTLAKACCQRLALRIFPLSLARALADKEIMESDQSATLSHIHTIFDRALQAAPSAVIIEDMDAIAKDVGMESQLHSTTVSILRQEMERARQGNNVFVIGISRNRAKLPETFVRPDLFQHEFNITVPLKAQRQEILEGYLRLACKDTLSDTRALALRTAQMTSGYVAKDLRDLCRSALLHSNRRNCLASETINMEDSVDNLGGMLERTTITNELEPRVRSGIEWKDLEYAIGASKPSQQVEFDGHVHQTRWGDFGGYSLLKKRVYQAVHWPITHPETFKRMGVKPPMGLLLYGPSGCGKTMLVQALASESNMNFIPIKGPEIFSKYLGETEATLRRLFAMARQIAPCILFFDEMDSIGAKRGWGGDGDSAGTNGVNERVLSTLLNEMDGVEERAGVIVIGCTNQPRAIDDALLRPGRLDQLIYLGYPTLKDRQEIIETIAKRIPLTEDASVRSRLAKETAGFSPADLEALFREAAIKTLRRDIKSVCVDIADIDVVRHKMNALVQDRVNKSYVTPLDNNNTGADVDDVLVPELYREFQQER